MHWLCYLLSLFVVLNCLVVAFLTSHFFQSHSQPSKSSNTRLLARTQDPSFALPLTNRTKLVIIAARFRSGSTFLGEIFNQNPDVLYDFETFHWARLEEIKGLGKIVGEERRHTHYELQLLNLQQILYNCSILRSPFAGEPNVMQKHWRCGRTAQENMAVSGKESCNEADPAPNITQIRQFLCRSKEAVVLKLIRLRRLSDLELIGGIRNTDVRVIYLLRDPRAMFRSRSGFKDIFVAGRNQIDWTREEQLARRGYEAHTECEWYLNDLRFIRDNTWLKAMGVRHEVYSANPVKVADQIYSFLELPLPQEVREFLGELGRGKGGESRDSLSTDRDSGAVVRKWFSWDIKNSIRAVDKHCARLIRELDLPFLVDQEITNFELKDQ